MRVVDRSRLIEILKSFYMHFLGVEKENSVLDLGCGDGLIIHELLKIDDSITSTLIDGSEHMLEKAKERLNGFEKTTFINMTFQELLRADRADTHLGDFDLVFSSLAIHHLTMDEKRSLFDCIYSHLSEGGCFVNIDILLSPTEDLEGWYLDLWRDWMKKRQNELKLEGDYEYTIGKYMEVNHHDTLSTLGDQLNALTDIGFKEVDCYYKYGVFAMYGGRK
ncbi:MAG: class I SAM-dependent methyltransferase [Halobacteriota archaeon]|nr:class I SAM-dependent methyltransferase [Halobacteriota archaeon]